MLISLVNLFAWIAEQAGFKVPEGTNILAAECAEVGPNELYT
jgi:acetaldehyde dehydrogenase/alcohol dehydrogenase